MLFGSSTGSSTGLGARTSFTTTSPKPANPVGSSTNNFYSLPEPPTDSISSISWAPNPTPGSTFIAAASWDRSVRVWEIRYSTHHFTGGISSASPNGNIEGQPRLLFQLDSPVLACHFAPQMGLFSAGCDQTVRIHNLAVNDTQILGKHDAPVSCLAFDEEKNICISGSWDNTFKLWDVRQRDPTASVNVGSKIYAMDCKAPLFVIATSNRSVSVYSTEMPQYETKKLTPLLRMQLRTIRLMKNKKGVALGSIEGRCAIQYFNPNVTEKDFPFKCHRTAAQSENESKVYPVNCVDFYPSVPSIMASSGGDGAVCFWETQKRWRLRNIENLGSPVVQGRWDATGHLFGFALSYDWSKGYEFAKNNLVKLCVCFTTDDMLRVKPGQR